MANYATETHSYGSTGRPRRVGQDHARRSAAAQGRRDPPGGQRRARHDRQRLRSAGKAVPALAALVARCTARPAARACTSIDTPGFPDFIGQAIGALDAVETAAVVVNAQAGIEMIASRMMDWAAQAQAVPASSSSTRSTPTTSTCRGACWPRSRRHSARSACRSTCPPTAASASSTASSTPSGEADFSSVAGRPPRTRRPGGRGRRGADGALPRAGRDRARAAACAVREGAARRASGAGVLRVGAHRRRRRGTARDLRQAAAQSRPKAIRRRSPRARARPRSSSIRSPIPRSTCWRTCSRW